jgi:hypothetical protein
MTPEEVTIRALLDAIAADRVAMIQEEQADDEAERRAAFMQRGQTMRAVLLLADELRAARGMPRQHDRIDQLLIAMEA